MGGVGPEREGRWVKSWSFAARGFSVLSPLRGILARVARAEVSEHVVDEPAPFLHVLGGEFPLCVPGRVHELPLVDHAWVRLSLSAGDGLCPRLDTRGCGGDAAPPASGGRLDGVAFRSRGVERTDGTALAEPPCCVLRARRLPHSRLRGYNGRAVLGRLDDERPEGFRPHSLCLVLGHREDRGLLVLLGLVPFRLVGEGCGYLLPSRGEALGLLDVLVQAGTFGVHLPHWPVVGEPGHCGLCPLRRLDQSTVGMVPLECGRELFAGVPEVRGDDVQPGLPRARG